jgi:hypothetical protein
VRGLTFLISLAASWTTVALSGLLAASLQNWFGVSDLRFLIICFAPAGLLAAAIAVAGVRRVFHWPAALRYFLGIGLGLVLGFLWTWCVALMLGPWWGAVSLPGLMCWMAGGASGVAGGLVLGPGNSLRARVASVIGLAGLAAVAVLANEPLGIGLSHDQRLTVRFLKWTPASGPLTIETEREDALSKAEVDLIRAAQPTGRLLVLWSGSRHGRGPAASALILLKEPITAPLVLWQPDRTTALYVQDGQRFVVYPSGTRTIDRDITISPHEDGVWCAVRIAGGGSQGGPVRVP